MRELRWQEFITGNEERAAGRELDFGAHWRLAAEPSGYPWRVTWNERTGELYAVELTPDRDQRRVLLFGVYSDRKAVEDALDGWATKPLALGPLVNPKALNAGMDPSLHLDF